MFKIDKLPSSVDEKVESSVENVYNYSITFGQDNNATLENVTFTNLTVFQTDGLPSQNLWWIDFVGKNENLKTLIQNGTRLFNEDLLYNQALLKLSEKAIDLNLAEVHLFLGKDVEAKNVVQFVKNNGQLKKLTVKVFSTNNVEIYVAFQEEFRDTWTLNHAEKLWAEIILEKNAQELEIYKKDRKGIYIQHPKPFLVIFVT